MTVNSGKRIWLGWIFCGFLIIILSSFLGGIISSAKESEWPGWLTELLRIVSTLAIGGSIALYIKLSGLADLTEEKVLKLLKPGAELELTLSRNGIGILLARHFLAINGKAIELPDFYRETLEHVSKTWSWDHSDNRIRFTVKGHLTLSVYPDFFQELAQKIVKGASEIKPQVKISEARQIVLT